MEENNNTAKAAKIMSDQSFYLRQTKYFLYATLALVSIVAGSCTYNNVHSDDAKVNISKHEAEKAMFEHMNVVK